MLQAQGLVSSDHSASLQHGQVVKKVHPVYSAGIRTHDDHQNMGLLPLPLYQGSRPIIA